MYAYVKNLTKGLTNPFNVVHTSRIFHYKGKNSRVKFDPAKYDVNTSYGIVVGNDLVKHQVLLIKESEMELQQLIKEQDSARLRSMPCPRRRSTGPVTQPLKEFTLIEEGLKNKTNDAKAAAAKQKVLTERNSKLKNKIVVQQTQGQNLVDTGLMHEPELKKTKLDDDEGSTDMNRHEGVKSEEAENSSEETVVLATSLLDRERKSLCGQMQIPNLPFQTTPVFKEHRKSDEGSVLHQLEVTRKELEMYKRRCSELEEDRSTNANIDCRLEKIETDISEIKGFMASAKSRAESKKVMKQDAKQCRIDNLTDVSPCLDKQYDIPEHYVHMADGKHFISKYDLVKVEGVKGLRPRLKKLLTYMYGKDLPNWYAKKNIKGQRTGHEITDRHIQSFMCVLQAMEWKKEVNLEWEHVVREVSKALSELKKEDYPNSEDSDEGSTQSLQTPDPPAHVEPEGNVVTGDLNKSFHESDVDGSNS